MVAAVLLAVQTLAGASLTIKWNTQNATAQHAAVKPAVLRGTLVALNGNVAELRLPDGTLRRYAASVRELAALRPLVGYSINFIVK